jgi:hypothetical protein
LGNASNGFEMKQRLTAALLGAGIALAAGSSAAADPAAAASPAARTVRHLELLTTLVADDNPAPIAGKLTLTIAADGTISGTYRGQDGSPQPVDGGLDGAKVWLDIGPRGDGFLPLQARGQVTTPDHLRANPGQRRLHVAGTLNDDRITATTFIRDEGYKFNAVPKTP